jgi:LDH2 family malate/lactate/ureidoglycolate dehydrogenase
MNQEGQDILVQPGPLREFAFALYQKAGVNREHAKLMADLQVETDLRSVHSHGTRMIPWYVRSMLDGEMTPSPDIRVVQEGPGFAVIDGDNGLGHPPSTLAMKMAIEKARSAGIAAAGVRNAGHFGAAACYSMMAVEAQMIGFSTTNTGGPSVGAPGSAEPVIANNPLSYALPAGEERPIVLDMACGASSWGKVRTLQMYGMPIPPGWLLTADGKPTEDPNEGKILTPAGGPRGYGLGLIMGILAGPLVGGLMSCQKLGDAVSEHFFIAINVASFTDFDEYTASIDQGIRTIQAAKPVEGVDQVYLPGEIEWRKREAWVGSGIPLHIDHLRDLANLAEELKVDICWEW